GNSKLLIGCECLPYHAEIDVHCRKRHDPEECSDSVGDNSNFRHAEEIVLKIKRHYQIETQQDCYDPALLLDSSVYRAEQWTVCNQKLYLASKQISRQQECYHGCYRS